MLKGLKLTAAVMAAMGVATPCALAQTSVEVPRNDSVADRARPETDPQGLRVRSFVVTPELRTDLEYIDNVFATNTNEQGDFLVGLHSNLGVRSDWSRHALRGAFSSDTLLFFDFDSEDRTSYNGNLEGQIDIGRSSAIGAGGVFRRQIQGRTSPETPVDSAELVQSNSRGVYVFANHTFNRVRLSARGERTGFNFNDIVDVNGDPVDLGFRDRVEYQVTGRVDYAISPDTTVFVEGGWNRRDFGDTTADDIDRNSTGQRALVGVATNLTNLLRGELAVGYLRQDYDSPLADTLSNVALRANLDYFVTPLTTISLRASREVQDTGVLAAAGLLNSTIDLRVDHELLRNLIIYASGGYQRQDFRGSFRTDDFFRAEAGARYFLNRYVGLGASYSYLNGDTTDPFQGRDFTVNAFRVSLTLQR